MQKVIKQRQGYHKEQFPSKARKFTLTLHSALLTLPFFKDLTSEQYQIHHRKECGKDDKYKDRMIGRESRKEHHRESKYDRGEVLIDHIVGSGGLELAVDLAEEDDTRARGARQHSVHHKELLLIVVGEESLGNDSVVDKGDNKPHNAENEHNTPETLKNVKSDSGNSRNDHKVEEEVRCAGHKEVVGVLAVDDLLFVKEIHHKLDKCCRKYAKKEVETVDNGFHSGKQIAENKHKKICGYVGNNDQRDLHRELINALLKRDLALRIDLFGMRASVGSL